MKFGIRFRFAVWLMAALLPASIAALYVFGQLEDQVSARVASDLEGVRELEAARIESGLDLYLIRGQNLAAGPHVVEFTARVSRARAEAIQDSAIGGFDGFDEIDAFADRPLQQLAEALQGKTAATTGEVAALQIQDLDGSVLGETPGFDWEPADATVVQRAITSRAAVFGNAFRDDEGADRLGLVVPILSIDDAVVGTLVLENKLGPITDLVVAHEGFGETSEAHIAQITRDGGAEFITLLRFERDAAFTKVVPAEFDLPINRSLQAPAGATIFAADYRGEQSILAVKTIEATGWGLVVKIDRAEALEPVLSHTGALKGVALLGALGVLIGWALLLDPVARRLRRMAEAAERVASGEYDRPIDDRSSDEIGAVARSIDQLATDLATDIAVRTDVEDRLRHQATHDATTGLYNRQFATSLMTDLAAKIDDTEAPGGAPFSVLFLDLDNFKAVNDVYGHGTGDAVLEITGEVLRETVGERGTAARWGGDEFVLVLPRTSEGAAQDIAAEVQRALDAPMVTVAGTHQVRASIGVSTLRSGSSLEQLLHTADEAMFAEKQSRSGRRSVSPESVRAVEQALDTDTVEVWFQPLVSGSGSSVTLRGAEALVRLRDRSGVVLEPASFLRDVERSFVGRDLDRRVLRTALAQVATWIENGDLAPEFELSVNCCEALMRDTDTVRFIESALEEFGLEPHNLMLEISEKSSVMRPSVIDELDRLGIKIAVDDLGLSNSNIDRLLDGGATVAKIDRRWLQAGSQAEDDANQKVLQHLVSLCDTLGFTVVAEGVETAEQYERISSLGVSRFQGYLFARPLTSDEFTAQFFES